MINEIDDDDYSEIDELKNILTAMRNTLNDKDDTIRKMMYIIRDLEGTIRELGVGIKSDFTDTDLENRLIGRDETISNVIRRVLCGIEGRSVRVGNDLYCNYDIILMKGQIEGPLRGVLNSEEINARKAIRVYMDPNRREKRRIITKRHYWKAKSGECEGGLC